MATASLRDDTYAYCSGECGAQVTKALYDELTQKNDGALLCVAIPTTWL